MPSLSCRHNLPPHPTPSEPFIREKTRLYVKWHIQNTLRRIGEFFEDQWFDRTRNVQTSGDVALDAAGYTPEQFADSEAYMPARPRHIRRALREMSVADVSTYSYIDLGSGKGRSLFVAAELAFRQIIGVELAPRLARRAQRNSRSFRPQRTDSPPIEILQENARDFAFPISNLVLYLFNPFGAGTMQCVLDHLDARRRQHPCHVVVILIWPQQSHLVAAREGMRLIAQRREYQIFEAPPL